MFFYSGTQQNSLPQAKNFILILKLENIELIEQSIDWLKREWEFVLPFTLMTILATIHTILLMILLTIWYNVSDFWAYH